MILFMNKVQLSVRTRDPRFLHNFLRCRLIFSKRNSRAESGLINTSTRIAEENDMASVLKCMLLVLWNNAVAEHTSRSSAQVHLYPPPILARAATTGDIQNLGDRPSINWRRSLCWQVNLSQAEFFCSPDETDYFSVFQFGLRSSNPCLRRLECCKM